MNRKSILIEKLLCFIMKIYVFSYELMKMVNYVHVNTHTHFIKSLSSANSDRFWYKSCLYMLEQVELSGVYNLRAHAA